MASHPAWRVAAAWLVPFAAGGAFGAGLAAVHRELYLTASGWWGAGNTSIGLLVRGPLELVDLYADGWSPPGVPAVVTLYAVQAVLLHRSSRGGRSRAVAAACYGGWTSAAAAAAAWHASRLGVAEFLRIEGGGWDGLAEHAPVWFAAFGVLLPAWHAFAWRSLCRRARPEGRDAGSAG